MANSAVTLEWFLDRDPEFTNLPNHPLIQWVKSLDTLSDSDLKRMLMHMDYSFDAKFRSWRGPNWCQKAMPYHPHTDKPVYVHYLNAIYRIGERRYAPRMNRVKQYFGANNCDYWQMLWLEDFTCNIQGHTRTRPNEIHYEVESLATTLQSLLVIYDKVSDILAQGPVDVEAMKFMFNVTSSAPEYLVAAVLSEISRSTGLALPRKQSINVKITQTSE